MGYLGKIYLENENDTVSFPIIELEAPNQNINDRYVIEALVLLEDIDLEELKQIFKYIVSNQLVSYGQPNFKYAIVITDNKNLELFDIIIENVEVIINKVRLRIIVNNFNISKEVPKRILRDEFIKDLLK